MLVAVAPEADGPRPGQSLAEARALVPGLIALEADPAGDAAALAALADWAARYTPMVAVDAEYGDGLWLDVTGCAHLFGGEAGLCADLHARLARHGLPARLALAGSTGAAWALAHVPGAGMRVLAAGEEAEALAGLPIAALRLEPRAVAGLRRLGVREVAALARLPREEVTARFGPGPVRRLDQALGAAAEAIGWRHAQAPWREVLAFAEPVGTAEDLRGALDILTERICARLAAAGQGGLDFAATFFRVDNTARDIAIATARPVRAAEHVAKLLAMKLERVDPGFGVEAVALAARALAPLSETQAEAFAVADEMDRLGMAVDRIANDIGAARVWRPVPVASHVPERAVGRGPALAPAAGWARDAAAPRPVRLLRRPEPIEVTAPVPDDPPILFRWRRRLHRVRAATGPERIAAEWWRARFSAAECPETERLRDYYQVEDTDGARFWLFRAGVHGGARAPRWFLHGLFS